MLRNIASEILNLIEKNEGMDVDIVFSNSNVDIQKIIEIILSESRCSIVDKDGNYARYGSSTDIRIIKKLIKLFISNMNLIPPEIVAMALTKEEVIGPFYELRFQKSYNSENDNYGIEIEEVFPSDFYTSIFDKNDQIKSAFIDEILTPYVKEIILDNEILSSRCPIGAFFARYFAKLKDVKQLEKSLIRILQKELKCSEESIENIAHYIIVNIMGNQYFKTELITRAIEASELQKLGKIFSGFNSLVESMISRTFKMIQMKNFPYGEYISIRNTYNTTIAVLKVICTNLENLDESEIINKIEYINKKYIIAEGLKRQANTIYREEEIDTDKYGNSLKYVKVKDINCAMQNLAKMIKVLLEKKGEINTDMYIKEVLRIQYRFIRINPFETSNGKTARALVNILLQSKGITCIFEKEKRNNYVEYLGKAHKIIGEVEEEYIDWLVNEPMKCIDVENEFLGEELNFLSMSY